MANYKKERIALYSALAIGVLVAYLSYGGNLLPQSDRDARRAISLAVQACGTNRFEFDRRVMDAKAEIDKLPPDRYWELETALENQLKLSGCKK